jgi:cytochrome oxidase assembly protein ShyY1
MNDDHRYFLSTFLTLVLELCLSQLGTFQLMKGDNRKQNEILRTIETQTTKASII